MELGRSHTWRFASLHDGKLISINLVESGENGVIVLGNEPLLRGKYQPRVQRSISYVILMNCRLIWPRMVLSLMVEGLFMNYKKI